MVGTVVRLLWIWATAATPSKALISDPVIYWLSGEKASHLDFSQAPGWPWGTGKPTSFLSVGYSNLIGLVSWMSAHNLSVFAAAMLVNLVASALLVIGVARVAAAVSYRTRWAVLVAPWAAAVYPDLVTASGLIMTEVVGVTALVWLVVGLLRSPQHWWMIGGCLAATIWLRPSLQLLLLVVPLLVWRWAGRGCAFAVAVTALIALAPLAYQSTVTVGVPVFSSSTWINICDGAAQAPGTPSGTFQASARCRIPDDQVQSEREWSTLAQRVALETIRNDPAAWVTAIPARLVHALGGGWGVEVAQNWSGHLGPSDAAALVTEVSRWSFWLVFSVGLLGAFSGHGERAVRLAALLAMLSLVGVAISFGQPRYGLPFVVLLCIPGLGLAADLASTRVVSRNVELLDRQAPSVDFPT